MAAQCAQRDTVVCASWPAAAAPAAAVNGRLETAIAASCCAWLPREEMYNASRARVTALTAARSCAANCSGCSRSLHTDANETTTSATLLCACVHQRIADCSPQHAATCQHGYPQQVCAAHNELLVCAAHNNRPKPRQTHCTGAAASASDGAIAGRLALATNGSSAVDYNVDKCQTRASVEFFISPVGAVSGIHDCSALTASAGLVARPPSSLSAPASCP